MELADEVFQRIEDATIVTQIDIALKMCKKIDLGIMRLIDERGPVHHRQEPLLQFSKKDKLSIVRLKARGLVIPVHQGKGYYKYDLTPLGVAVLKASESPQREEAESKVSKILSNIH